MGIIVNTENYNQRSRSLHLRDKWHKQVSIPQKERSSEKSHNTNTKFHFREVTITLVDYKIFLYISKNYNQQSRSHRLTPSQGKNHKKEKENKKEKRKEKEKEKKGGYGEKRGERNNGENRT